jgi:four helix bundle protein
VKIERFEDLEVWQLTRELLKSIYKLTAQIKFSKDLVLVNQIRGSAVSIMSNIAEGFERKSKKEFIHYLYTAKGLCGELRSQLYIASDLNYIKKDEFQENYQLAEKISKSLAGFIKYLQSCNLESSNP